MQIGNPTKRTIRGPANFAVIFAVFLPALISCSAEAPQGVAEPAASSEAASPFSRLTDPGGCVIEQITTADYDEYQVQGASADGKLLSMTASPEGPAETGNDSVYQVYEMDLTTGEKTGLSRNLQNSGPFSPDGRFNVVAQPADNGKTDIFEYERATGELRAVTSHEDWDWLPSYSPDGRLIVFNSFRVGGQSDIYLLDKSTGMFQRLTEDPAYEANAEFSPDGKRILFHRQRGKRDEGGYIFDLMVYDMETGRETRLTDGDYEESYPSWAPDGSHIAYSSDVGGKQGKHNLYILTPDGEAATRLTQGDWVDRYSFWSRDGKFIYFNSDRAGVTNIYRMPMEGVDCVLENF